MIGNKGIARFKPGIGLCSANASPGALTSGLCAELFRCRLLYNAALLIILIKGAALPSIIGTSSADNSISRLSMPSPQSADIRCSTVATCAEPSAILVDRVVSATYSARAGILLCAALRSERKKAIPVFASAGQGHADFFARMNAYANRVNRPLSYAVSA